MTGAQRAALQAELHNSRLSEGMKRIRVDAGGERRETTASASASASTAQRASPNPPRDRASPNPRASPNSNSLLPSPELRIAELIGSGTYGHVRRATWRGTPVAVKQLNRNLIGEAQLRAFKRECELQLNLRHPNIVQLLGGSWDIGDAAVFLVLEYCAQGTLAARLKDRATREAMRTELRRRVAVGIARGMQYLHSQAPPIAHRDLKPDNVLLDASLAPKIADFGVSTYATSLQSVT